MNLSVFLQKEGRTAAATKITLCGRVQIFMKRIRSIRCEMTNLEKIFSRERKIENWKNDINNGQHMNT